MPYDVFISHSKQDKAVAEAVCAILEAEKIHCWIAPRDIQPGADWAGAIMGALESCRVMILVFSSSSNTSPQVKREVEQAFNNSLIVVPFRIEDVQPNPSLKYYIGAVHWLDALTEPLERYIAKLVPIVRAIVGVGDAPAPAAINTPPAPAAKTIAPVVRQDRPAVSHPQTQPALKPSEKTQGWSDPMGGYSSYAAQAAAGRIEEMRRRSAAVPVSAPAVIKSPVVARGNQLLSNTLLIDLGGGVAMDFVLIHPGVFIMGSDKGGSDEKPAHKVRITKPFYVGKFEVTQEQWKKIMGATPSFFKGSKLPVENVNWDDCQIFLAKLKEKAPGTDFRLPTEAQWEYVCRAGTTTEYSFGDSDALFGDYAWYSSNSESKTHEVGKKKPNAWGLFDMLGNVWEWCSDWKGNYSAAEAVDPAGPSSGQARVLRGGSCGDYASRCRSAYRNLHIPTVRNVYFGLRLVVVPR